jgi:hypothetical protein
VRTRKASITTSADILFESRRNSLRQKNFGIEVRSDLSLAAGNASRPTLSETSGYPVVVTEGPRLDVPAIEVIGASIVIDRATFVRADSDRNGELELTDAVRTLGTLFLGTDPLPCEDAADANDDGILNIADPVFTLNFLFTGGTEPPTPFPEAGLDPTDDSLDCLGISPGGGA